MNDDELSDTREKLRLFAQVQGLQWVLAEVDDAVELGVVEVKTLRPQTRQGKTVYEETSKESPSTRGRKRTEEFLSRRPMTYLEQVDQLVAALRRVLVELDAVAETAVTQLNALPSGDPDLSAVSEIDFAPDEGSATPPVTTEAIRHQDRGRTAQLLDQLVTRVRS